MIRPDVLGLKPESVYLGRQTSKALVSDPQGATTVATAYDSSGRISTRSNPCRSTSDPTYGVDANAYDGRTRNAGSRIAMAAGEASQRTRNVRWNQ